MDVKGLTREYERVALTLMVDERTVAGGVFGEGPTGRIGETVGDLRGSQSCVGDGESSGSGDCWLDHYNGGMGRRSFTRWCSLVLLTGAVVSQAQDQRGRKYKPPPETMRIAITVVRASNGKPIPSAAVIFHPVDTKGHAEGALELKTDLDGKTVLDVIPVGETVRLQVIAHGFQTFGNDYLADASAKEITIRLKRPGDQYSVYKGNATGDQSGQAQETTAEPKKPE